MNEKHKIVTLVGSTSSKWQQQYHEVAKNLCLAGYVVISVNLFKTDVDDIEKYRELLESIHFQKMDMADVVVLIHKNAIGPHTQLELNYCDKRLKLVVVYTTIEETIRDIKAKVK